MHHNAAGKEEPVDLERRKGLPSIFSKALGRQRARARLQLLQENVKSKPNSCNGMQTRGKVALSSDSAGDKRATSSRVGVKLHQQQSEERKGGASM